VAHAVKLDVFEGPIDLLLHLITRRRVDIYDVPLAEIAAEYLDAVRAMDDLDLEAATGFLVVAASLLELKSARLLPGPAPDSDEARLLEERDLLLARLVECSTYRAAGLWIAQALREGAAYIARAVTPEPQIAAVLPDLLGGTSTLDLARAAGRLLAPHPAPVLDTTHVAPATASVRAAILDLCSELRVARDSTFSELCRAAAGRVEVVARFLALLELFKSGAVDLTQAERFGDIRARWTGEVTVDDVIAEADEYASGGRPTR
jgi:segregation and condensation protein A